MKTLVRLGLAIVTTAALSLAITMYRGRLVDASCYNQNTSNAGHKAMTGCAPTDSTTAFAIYTEGKVRMLDQAGNDKALAALKGGYLKRDANGDFNVIIDGHRHGDTIQVEGIRGHKSDVSVH